MEIKVALTVEVIKQKIFIVLVNTVSACNFCEERYKRIKSRL